jgi:hypothetical protein
VTFRKHPRGPAGAVFAVSPAGGFCPLEIPNWKWYLIVAR